MKQLTFLIAFLTVMIVQGQTSLRPNIYFQDMNYYNISAGINDTNINYQVSIYGKRKFVSNDVWDKPISLFANHIGRIKSISSFYSAGYIFDKYSFYDRHTIYGGYTYQVKLPKTNRLNIGIRGVFNFDHVLWKRLQQVDGKPKSSIYFTPDIDFGIQYQVKGFTLGLSSKNLIANTKRVDGQVLLKNQRELYSNISYAFNIKNKIVIAPYTLFYLERKWDLDMGIYLSFFNIIHTSYHFRLKELRNVYTLGANIYRGFYLDVSVDHSSIYHDINFDFQLGYRF